MLRIREGAVLFGLIALAGCTRSEEYVEVARAQQKALKEVHAILAEIRDEQGRAVATDLWTTCFTPRELRLLFERAGFAVDEVWAVEPGNYRPAPPDTDHPEFLVVATRP